MSDFKHHTVCEGCGSSDANAVYSDGHTYCHSCETYLKGDEEPKAPVRPMPDRQTSPLRTDGKDSSLHDRNISKETAQRFGVQVLANGPTRTHHLYPYYKDGVMVAQKVRDIENKHFSSTGNIKGAELFGQHRGKGKKYVTIFEGECDAMAGYQMMNFPDASCVSIKGGMPGGLRDFKDHNIFEWVDSHDSIIISFDADKPGQDGAKKLAEIFAPGKAKIMQFKDGLKDANDYLLKGKAKDFVKLWWAAETYTPDGIVNGNDLWEEVNKDLNLVSFDYPWIGLNDLTYGMRLGEMITLTAGSGMGKTQILREIQHHVFNTTDFNIGCLYLEETKRDTGLGWMSTEISKPLHLPDCHSTEDERRQAFERTLATERIWVYDSFGSNSVDNVVSRIRYLAKGLDCKFIILDHISIIVSDQSQGDERRALDEIATKLKTVCIELEICLFMVSHSKRQQGKSHEEGGKTSLSDLRGTAAIGQLSNFAIGLERDGQDPDPIIRNTTTVRVLKNRFSGQTGPACRVFYDRVTGRLTETDEEVGDDD